jgi:hypothetical protein
LGLWEEAELLGIKNNSAPHKPYFILFLGKTKFNFSQNTKKHLGFCEEVKLFFAPRVASPSTKIQYQIGNEGKQECVKDRKILKIDLL